MHEYDNDQIARRHEELEQLEAKGVLAYPYSFPKTHSAVDAIGVYSDDEESRVEVAVAGRIVAIRKMGKASFCHIQDQSGRIQLYLRKDELENYDDFKLYDIGDIIGAEGYMFRTRTGEVSLRVSTMTLLTKALVPLPVPKEETDEEGNTVVHNRFADKELRYRQRYLDLNVNSEIRTIFRKRAKTIATIRRFLDEKEYLEVETPVLHTMYGGAAARPFGTHMNALNIPLYLRISLELNLKRLMVGGFEGIYELGKNFRNEGLDRTHNPEFTMLELYVAYQDYTWMAELVEQMISETAQAVNGSLTVKNSDGVEINLEPPFKRATMIELIREVAGVDIEGKDREQLKEIAEGLDLHVEPSMGKGKIIDEIFGERVQPTLIQPTYVMDLPVEMVPLAKRHRENEELVEAWELIIDGKEIAPCFSELNDPRDQRRRLEEQARLHASGDEEAMLIDEDFLHALEVGMPPAAGLGVGIDRLVMLLTEQDSVRDVIFFPMMRPQQEVAHESESETTSA